MKVQVNLKIASKFDASTALFNFTVNLMDTVLSVKERFSAAHMIAFPDRELFLDGNVLLDESKLVDCGVKENSSLDFVVRASEGSLVKQFAELLQTRDLSCDEIGMLYCYKHGVSASQSLKTIGYDGKLVEFLKTQKSFLVENGLVTLVREDTKMKPFSVIDELQVILEKSGTGSMEMALLSSKFSKKFNMSIASVAGMKAAELLATRTDVFVVSGRGSVSLKSAGDDDAEQKLVQAILASHCPRVPSVVEGGLNGNVSCGPPGLNPREASEEASLAQGGVPGSNVEQTLDDIVDTISQAMFLNVHHVVKGWSVGQDTADASYANAEVQLFLQGLPAAAQTKWLPALLKSVAGVLTESLCPAAGRRQFPAMLKSNAGRWMQGVGITDDSLQIKVKDVVAVTIRFSPLSDS